MTIFLMSPAEFIHTVLTAILIYVTWKVGKSDKDKNTKK